METPSATKLDLRGESWHHPNLLLRKQPEPRMGLFKESLTDSVAIPCTLRIPPSGFELIQLVFATCFENLHTGLVPTSVCNVVFTILLWLS